MRAFQKAKNESPLWKALSKTEEGKKFFSFAENMIGKSDFSKIRDMYINAYGQEEFKKMVSVFKDEIGSLLKELYSETEKIIL